MFVYNINWLCRRPNDAFRQSSWWFIAAIKAVAAIPTRTSSPNEQTIFICMAANFWMSFAFSPLPTITDKAVCETRLFIQCRSFIKAPVQLGALRTACAVWHCVTAKHFWTFESMAVISAFYKTLLKGVVWIFLIFHCQIKFEGNCDNLITCLYGAITALFDLKEAFRKKGISDGIFSKAVREGIEIGFLPPKRTNCFRERARRFRCQKQRPTLIKIDTENKSAKRGDRRRRRLWIDAFKASARRRRRQIIIRDIVSL